MTVKANLAFESSSPVYVRGWCRKCENRVGIEICEGEIKEDAVYTLVCPECESVWEALIEIKLDFEFCIKD